MEYTQTEVAVISNKAATACHLEAGSSKQVEYLLLLLVHDQSRAGSKLMPFLIEAEGHLSFCLEVYTGKSQACSAYSLLSRN